MWDWWPSSANKPIYSTRQTVVRFQGQLIVSAPVFLQYSGERGQALFNSKPISITRVAGLNDATGLPVIAGTCGTCHDSFNAGNHSVSAPLNIGVADTTNPLGVDYLPVDHASQHDHGSVPEMAPSGFTSTLLFV
jgi:hypothetical protein